MDTVFSTVLICTPLAFLAGWLVCKSVVKQNSAATSAETEDDTSIPTDFNPNATIQRPDGRRVLKVALETGVHQLENLSSAIADAAEVRTLKNELQHVKEALTERDHVIADLKAQISDLPPDMRDMSAAHNTAEPSQASADELQSLHEKLADAEHRNLLLSGQLHSAEALADQKVRHMVDWRNRAKPIIRQCRQQSIIISELRNQLRENSIAMTDDAPLTVEVPSDDLKVLHGIGPALEKRMNKQGIFCYRQLAAMTEAELGELGQLLGIGRNLTLGAEWLVQAKLLASSGGTDATAAANEAANDSTSESTETADTKLLPA